MNLKLYAVFHDLSGKRSLELINRKLSRPIGRSTYYNHKKKLYEDEKYQSLKKSIYKSKLLKCFLLYLDGSDEPDGGAVNLRINFLLVMVIGKQIQPIPYMI